MLTLCPKASAYGSTTATYAFAARRRHLARECGCSMTAARAAVASPAPRRKVAPSSIRATPVMQARNEWPR